MTFINLFKMLPASAALVVATGSGMLRAQTQAPAVAGGSPAFAVASVKENHDPDGPRLFSAQLGVTLRPSTAPVDVFVIDSVSRPAPD
jgi:uncharacterized protein (TIGR03435 family)